MKTFFEFIAEDAKDLNESRYVYHGTTSYNLRSILKNGLQPSTSKGNRKVRRIYVTRDGEVTSTEAHATCFGDGATGTPGQGGEPVVLKIDRLHPSIKNHNFKVDTALHRTKKQR